MLVFVLLILVCAWACQAREFADKMDRYLIACHTTDFTCFKRQYAALRDNVLLGNTRLAIDKYQPLSVQYGPGCVQVEGWTESELIGIGMDSTAKELTMAFELPLHMKRVKNQTNCLKPQIEFINIPDSHNGTLMQFTGNATVSVTFPFSLHKKKGDVYLVLDEEEVDLLLDLPVYIPEDSEPEVSEVTTELTELNQASDWAFDIVQHIDAAKDFALPFTSRLRTALGRIPFRRLMLLYPEENYSDLQFAFVDSTILLQ